MCDSNIGQILENKHRNDLKSNYDVGRIEHRRYCHSAMSIIYTPVHSDPFAMKAKFSTNIQ